MSQDQNQTQAKTIQDLREELAATDALLQAKAREVDALIEERKGIRVELAKAQEERDKYKAVADAALDLVDPDPCRLDHHGYCQAHGWLQEGECVQARLKRHLTEAGYDLAAR